MATCEHGNPALTCVVCKKVRHDQIFGGIYTGEVGLRGRASTSINYDISPERRMEEAEREDQMAREFVLNSFPVQYKSEEDE
tara:strand:+ start:27 stop:272 length:246 start_codon:yes stop_codon:yes gene_type:complete